MIASNNSDTAAIDEAKSKSTTIFLKGVPLDWEEKDIRGAYEKFGEVTEVKVGKTSTGRALGYCFVSFAAREQAEKAHSATTDGSVVEGSSKWKVDYDIGKDKKREYHIPPAGPRRRFNGPPRGGRRYDDDYGGPGGYRRGPPGGGRYGGSSSYRHHPYNRSPQGGYQSRYNRSGSPRGDRRSPYQGGRGGDRSPPPMGPRGGSFRGRDRK